MPVSTLDYPVPPDAQPTVATVKRPPTKAEPEPEKPAPAFSIPPPAEIAKIKSAKDRKPTTTEADLQREADRIGKKYRIGKHTIISEGLHDSGMRIVYIEVGGKEYRSLGMTPMMAYDNARKKAERSIFGAKK